jgi:hypothetical protein
MLVGCFFLAGKTLLIYSSPTLIFSNTFSASSFSSSRQHSSTANSASASGVKKKGKEYLSCPVLFLTRWTVAGNLPLVCFSRYCPTLHTKVPCCGGASTQMPSWFSTSRAGTESCKTNVIPGARSSARRGAFSRSGSGTYTRSLHVLQGPRFLCTRLEVSADSAKAASP